MHLRCGSETVKGGVRPIDVRKECTDYCPGLPTTGTGGTVPPHIQRPAICLRPGAGVPADLPLHRLGPGHKCHCSVFAHVKQVVAPLSALFHLDGPE